MKKKIRFGLPRGWELFFLMAMLFSLFGLFQSSNLLLKYGLNWTTHFSASLTFQGIIAFWILMVLFVISTVFVIASSVLDKSRDSTYNGYDTSVGFAMLLGVFFITIGAINGIVNNTPTIPFLYGIKSILILQIGWALETFGTIWYAITS